MIANTAERADGGWHTEWAALRDLLRTTGAVTEILAELTGGLEVFPEAMRRNLDIHGNYLMLGRITQWLGPVVEAHGSVPKGTGKHFVQTTCQQAISDGDDLAETLVAKLPEGLVSVDAINTVLDPSGYLGGAATIVAEVNSRYRKWSI